MAKQFKYKMLKFEDYQDLTKKSEKDLNSEFMKAQKNERAGKKQKKEDHKIEKLKDKIALHRKENETKEMKDLKEKLKKLKQEVDEQIKDEIADKKALESGYNNLIKEFKEIQDAILTILKDREL